MQTFHLVIDTNSTNSHYPNTMPVAVLEITEEVLSQLQRTRQQFRNASPHSGWFAPIRGVEVEPDLYDAVELGAVDVDTTEAEQAWINAFEDVRGSDPAFIVMTDPAPNFSDGTDADLDFAGRLYYSERKGFWWRWAYDDADGVLETRAIKLSDIEAKWQELNGSLPAYALTVADLFSEAAASSIVAAQEPTRFMPEGIGEADTLPNPIFAPILAARRTTDIGCIDTAVERLIDAAEEALVYDGCEDLNPEAVILYIAGRAIEQFRRYRPSEA